MLSYIPVEYEDRDAITPLADAAQEKKVLINATVVAHNFIFLKHKKQRLLIISLQDESGQAELHCYGREFLKNVLSIGSSVFIWGKWGKSYGKTSSSTFEIITQSKRKNAIVPRYRLPYGVVSQSVFYTYIEIVLDAVSIPNLHAYHNAGNVQKDTAMDITREQACRMLHAPQSQQDIEISHRYFAFDEVFLFQLTLQYEQKKALTDLSQPKSDNAMREKAKELIDKLMRSLEFSLTRGQIGVINEITADMEKPYPMRRLLQGDVGAGKTVVALCCAMHTIAQGGQVCLAVPSEALALQHFKTIQKMFRNLPISVDILTGSLSTTQRRETLVKIEEGSTHCIVGTHALYSKDVQYKNLSFVIIDEQHRFGLAQRSALFHKGKHAHGLLMSATPIPRSLALTVYGSMDVSTLKEKLAFQKPVATRIILQKNINKVYQHVKKKLDNSEQAFFVFPQIENQDDENKTTDLISAEEMYPLIKQSLAPHSTALLHSKIPTEEKDAILLDFSNGKIAALVSTTIIEVGIDVADATTMCIFDAHRFGLSTLHQLRGRVGRGEKPGEALLVYRHPLSDISKQRLKVIYEETDGFLIAEKDLSLRGPGDINQLGLRQSGHVLFQFVDVFEQKDILHAAHSCVKNILQKDPLLEKKEHQELKKHIVFYDTVTV